MIIIFPESRDIVAKIPFPVHSPLNQCLTIQSWLTLSPSERFGDHLVEAHLHPEWAAQQIGCILVNFPAAASHGATSVPAGSSPNWEFTDQRSWIGCQHMSANYACQEKRAPGDLTQFKDHQNGRSLLTF